MGLRPGTLPTVAAGVLHQFAEAVFGLAVSFAVDVDDLPVGCLRDGVGEAQHGLGLPGAGGAGDEQVMAESGER